MFSFLLLVFLNLMCLVFPLEIMSNNSSRITYVLEVRNAALKIKVFDMLNCTYKTNIYE